MGPIREDGGPKPGLARYAPHAADMGLMQGAHFEDPRLDDAVAWLRRLGMWRLRTGLSWTDGFRFWAFDRQMEVLAELEVMAAFCFPPEHLAVAPHHTSPPRDPHGFADFCAPMVERSALVLLARSTAMGRR